MKLFAEMEKVFAHLRKAMDKKALAAFAACDYKILCAYHFGLGTYIRNNLLKEDGELYRAFIRGSVTDKDDMSVLTTELFYIYIATERG